MSKQSKIAWIVIAALIVMLLAYNARIAGEKTATENIERLQLLWPDFMTLPERDRAFLAGLSMTCKLNTIDNAKEKVIACLRHAVVDPDIILPKSEQKAEASARLEHLLSRADYH